MKAFLYLLNFQIIFSFFFVDGKKIIPLFGHARRKRGLNPPNIHWLQLEHMPEWYLPPQLEKTVNSTRFRLPMPDPTITPDYRLEEPPFLARHESQINVYKEYERPLRISPHYKLTSRWARQQHKEKPNSLGCYCTTVYRKFIMLAGCAVLTKRHVLTTASSTDLILNKIKTKEQIADVLGLWYDINEDVYNSSVYIGPARIHHHPGYSRPHTVNISHPIPCQNDLSLWTTVHNMHTHAVLCSRGGSHQYQFSSSVPLPGDLAIIVGFQFVKAYKKVPMPWFKYAVRTKKHIVPCPKTEWGWFHCILGNWAKFGIESGAAWHRALENKNFLYDGLIGMAAFSMQLRSEEITHYFTVINTHSTLDFLYDAYMGTLPFEFLDARFENTQYRVPQPKPGQTITEDNNLGEEKLSRYELSWYKKK